MVRITIMLLAFTMVSCSNDGDSDQGPLNDGPLNGQWTLTDVSCFCGFPDPPDFNLTQVTFNTQSNEIMVVNSGESTYFREDGTYSYTGSGNRIVLEDEKSYDFEIIGEVLRLTFVDQPNIADDEVTYTLEKD